MMVVENAIKSNEILILKHSAVMVWIFLGKALIALQSNSSDTPFAGVSEQNWQA